MNNTTRYDNLFKRLKTNTSQREAIGTQLSNEKDKLNKMKEDCRSIQRAFSANGLQSIRGKVPATDADVKWHGKSWRKWETILKTYETLYIPKLIQSVYKMQCDLDRLSRQRQSISEQMDSIRYYNRSRIGTV